MKTFATASATCPKRRALVDVLQGSKDSGRLVHDLARFDEMLCCHDSPLRQVLIESAGRVTGPA